MGMMATVPSPLMAAPGEPWITPLVTEATQPWVNSVDRTLPSSTAKCGALGVLGSQRSRVGRHRRRLLGRPGPYILQHSA